VTVYLSFRSCPVGGAVADPHGLEGDGTADPPALASLPAVALAARAAGKNVLFAVHGFNVSYDHGARSLGQLEPQLGLGASDLFVALLWPGDFWLPAVNYPFEGGTAMDCGRRLAAFCKRWLGQAQSLSFISHSLGARLVLEAVRRLDRRAQSVCLTAAAINRDCLSAEYAAAAANASAIAILASRRDLVLRLAYPIGDPIADLFNEDHTFFEPALGYKGPPTPAPPPIAPPWQIPNEEDYGHHDYLPPGDAVAAPPDIPAARWVKVAGFAERAFRGMPQTWPR
jgi:Alpha/beta hydrolase of unknown function (DUF900)